MDTSSVSQVTPAGAERPDLRRPDPTGAATVAEFVQELRLLKVWAGDPSYDDLRRRTDLPRSTVAAAFSGRRRRLPPLDLLRRLVRTLDGAEQVRRWEEAWTRLRVVETAELDPAADSAVPGLPPVAVSWRGQRPGVQDLVGRAADTAELLELLARRQFVNLVGPGGVGKTSLALEVAGALSGAADPDGPCPDGVAVADLAAAADDDAVADVVGALFGLRAPAPIDLLDSLVAVLGGRRSLLVLDNCEHVAAGCRRLLARLLPACPELTVLATSRQVLGVQNERVRQVEPLALPPDTGPVDPATAALALFLRRAAEAAPARGIDESEPADLAAAARVCRRLDGLPLALELAAARLRTIDVAQLAGRLEVDLGLLRVGRPGEDGRHTTLAAMVDWSYLLLDPVEQRLLDRLSVFRGGFRLAAAEAVCAGEPVPRDQVLPTLVRLVDRSLVQAYERGGALRYRLLEAVREHSADRLGSAGETDLLADRHLDFLLGWLTGTLAVPRFDDRVARWREAFAEVDNLRAALTVGFRRRPLVAAEVTLLAFELWYTLLHMAECRRWLAAVEEHRAALSDRLRCLLDARQGLIRAANEDQSAAAVLCTGALDGLREHWPRYYHETLGNTLFFRTCALDAGVLDAVPGAIAAGRAATATDPESAAHVLCGTLTVLVVWGRQAAAAEVHELLMAVPAVSSRVLTYQAALGLLTAGRGDDRVAAERRLTSARETAMLHPETAVWATASNAFARDDPAAARTVAMATSGDALLAGYRGHAGPIVLAEAARRLGDVDAAGAHLRAVLRPGPVSTDYMIETAAVLVAALLAATVGDPAAADLAARWDAERRRAGLPVPVGFAAEAARLLGLDPAGSAVGAGYRWDTAPLRELIAHARTWCAGRG